VTYLEGHPSKSTAYIGFHPDGDPSGSFLKDGGSPTLTAELAYNGSYPDSHPSKSTAYLGSYPDGYHDNATSKLRVSTQVGFAGTIVKRTLPRNYMLNQPKRFRTKTAPLANATRSQSQAEIQQIYKQYFHLNSLLFHRVFHDYIHPRTSMGTSNKSNTRSFTCMYSSQEKIKYAIGVSPTTFMRWLRNKQSFMAGRVRTPRTP